MSSLVYLPFIAVLTELYAQWTITPSRSWILQASSHVRSVLCCDSSAKSRFLGSSIFRAPGVFEALFHALWKRINEEKYTFKVFKPFLSLRFHEFKYLAIIEFGFRRIWSILQIEEGVIHRGRRPRWITPSEIDLQNSSYPRKAEFNNCFIIHWKYFSVLK